MFVFTTGPEYRLPFPMIELDRMTYTHTHRTPWHTTWKEDITLIFGVPGFRPQQLRVANDNQKAA
ncbi:hypothetical protein [Bradyrhizobium phage BDU-MI-1]|nr:hypothetical protein [Bradyrhizobium phage BDU-MI-1]